jgi:hypothetical protein
MASLPVPAMQDDTMPDTELVAILGAYEASAIGYNGADNDITAEQERALNYYNGVMDDVPAQEGCSSVVDGTVALVVDNALAAVLKPFVSSDETVRFAPRGPEDMEIADQATEYVNYVFNCDNPGFLILHNWFKDAFLAKVGVVKIWWEDEPRFETEQVEITDDLTAQFIRSREDYLGEENGIAVVGRQIPDGRVRVENIPPEEFRISPASRDDLTAPYLAHVPSTTTRSDLIEMGFDAEVVESLPAYSTTMDDSSLRQARYGDESYSDTKFDSAHKANDRIALRDEYARIDYDGDGIAELRRIMRVNDVILLNEEVEDHPFASLCPIPMPHKFFGHSLADRAIQEQKIGTVLWRQSLDNLYKSNNPRVVIGEAGERVDGSTADSLMDPAPGAAILARDVQQIRFDAVPYFADKSFAMMELLDKKVEENTGVQRAGQGLDTNALRKSGQMTATEMAMIAAGKNARTEMVARIFAETGVTRLFKVILNLVSTHQPKARVIRLRNKWVEVDPRGWPEMDVVINVGLGVGDKAEQIAQADSVLQTMAEVVQSPFAYMVSPENAYNAIKRKYTASGIKNTDDYITEPQPGMEQMQPPDPEQMKVEGQLQLQAAKQQGEQQIAAIKLEQMREEALLKQQLARQEAEFEAQLAIEKMEREFELAERKMQFEAQLAEKKAAAEAERRKTETDAKISQNRPGGDLDK